MQHTLIAVFDNHADAMSAKNELLSSGFSSSDVRLSHGDEPAPSGSISKTDDYSGSPVTATSVEEPGIGASIKNFFSDLFGSDTSEHSAKYSNAVQYGNHVLTVSTDSEPEVERAADIVERFGPIDIDEQSAKWGAGTGSAIGAGAGMSSGAMMGSAGSMSGGQSLSLQSDPDRLPLNQQSLNDPNPMGTTYQEPMGSRDQLSVGSYGAGTGSSLQQNLGSSLEGSASTAGSTSMTGSSMTGSSMAGSSTLGSQQRDTGSGAIPVSQNGPREIQRGGMRVYSRGVGTAADASDARYRDHFSSTYGGSDGKYEDYAPAYSYGSDMRRDQKYSGRQWDDVESDLRSDWDTRSGSSAGATWEKMKSAVKQGWDRMTDDDDDYYRSHYSSTYGNSGSSYDTYKPAYSYGSQMRQSDLYRNRPWDEVEPSLRSDWETRNTGSTWENMKDAVRHGWNKMTK